MKKQGNHKADIKAYIRRAINALETALEDIDKSNALHVQADLEHAQSSLTHALGHLHSAKAK